MVQKKRHLVKTVTWRITATTTTVIITWLVTGNFETGAIVGGFEAVVKMFLYYAHERMWLRSRYGIVAGRKA